MDYFPYGELEIKYLKSKDPLLGNEIERIGFIKRPVNTDLFSSLISSIISQQISTAAAKTINNRLITKAGEITATALYKLGIDEIQSCGLSFRKTNYIKEITDKVINNHLDLESLKQLGDEEVIKELIKLKGIGKWTAEMILIFSLLRTDILSYDDLAIQRGLRMLYNLENIDKDVFNQFKNIYSPYGSIASIYLWEISSGGYGHIDPRAKVK